MSRTINQPAYSAMQRGFTILELMITVAVAAILLVIAVPSFKHTIASTNLTATTNGLLADIKYARTQAVSTGATVAVAASSSGNWADGWRVVDADGNVVRVHEPIDSGYTLKSGGGETKVVFDARGTLESSTTTVCLTLTAPSNTRNEPVRLLVRPVGSVSQFEGAADPSANCTS